MDVRAGDPPSGLSIDTGDGHKPVTAHEWSRSLALQCILHPAKVEPGDDETRAVVEQVRYEPETLRLQAQLARERLAARAAVPVVVGQPRSQNRRAPRPSPSRRTRRAASRGDPSSESDEPEPPLGLSLAQLAGRAGVSPRSMRRLLVDFETDGVVECVGAEYWRLTEFGNAAYGEAFRSIRWGNTPLEPGDDDGLDHCKPGPPKAAAAAPAAACREQWA